MISSQGARESTKVWYCGRIPGSPSKAPRRIDTSCPSGQLPPNRLEPQVVQNAFTAAPGAGR